MSKKIMVATVVTFIASSIFNFLIHGFLLTSTYQQNASLMRGPQDSQSHAVFLILSFAIFSWAFVWIYSKGVTTGPWLGQGLRYGLAMWLIVAVSRYLIYYAIQPWPMQTVLLQIGYELVMMMALGIIVAAFWK